MALIDFQLLSYPFIVKGQIIRSLTMIIRGGYLVRTVVMVEYEAFGPILSILKKNSKTHCIFQLSCLYLISCLK